MARLARMTANDMIASLVVVDNARIEQIYSPPTEERKNIISFVKQYKEGMFKE